MKVMERQQAFSKEVKELFNWEEQESNRVITRLKLEGKKIGLDSYSEEFVYIRRERNRRWREILEKYKDLPPSTKIKSW